VFLLLYFRYYTFSKAGNELEKEAKELARSDPN
jgi:hypothetical protein